MTNDKSPTPATEPLEIHEIKPGTMAAILWPDKKYFAVTFDESIRKEKAHDDE